MKRILYALAIGTSTCVLNAMQLQLVQAQTGQSIAPHQALQQLIRKYSEILQRAHFTNDLLRHPRTEPLAENDSRKIIAGFTRYSQPLSNTATYINLRDQLESAHIPLTREQMVATMDQLLKMADSLILDQVVNRYEHFLNKSDRLLAPPTVSDEQLMAQRRASLNGQSEPMQQ